jgi:hypothetical protein
VSIDTKRVGRSVDPRFGVLRRFFATGGDGAQPGDAMKLKFLQDRHYSMMPIGRLALALALRGRVLMCEHGT